jgi:predicted Zn-dependent protease
VQAGRADGRRRSCGEIIALDPKEPKHRARLAALYAQSGDLEAAQGVLRQAVADLPDNPSVKLMLVQLLAHVGDPAAAERELLGFVKVEPGDYDLRFALAGLYEAQGKADQARAIYTEIVSLDGRGQHGLSARDALARLDILAGNTKEAAALLEEELAENSHDRKALVLRATLSLAGGDADAAVADLRSALRSSPDSVDVLRLLDRAYAQRKEPALGIEALQRAVELAPQDPTLRLELARLAIQGGQNAAARPHLEAYLAQKPDDPAALELQFRLRPTKARGRPRRRSPRASGSSSPINPSATTSPASSRARALTRVRRRSSSRWRWSVPRPRSSRSPPSCAGISTPRIRSARSSGCATCSRSSRSMRSRAICSAKCCSRSTRSSRRARNSGRP